MAMALMAWLTAPAPIAWTSARLCSRTTPAMAPATAEVRDPAETLMVSIRPPPLAEEHRASVRAVVARLYRIQDSESSVSRRGVALHLHAVGRTCINGGSAGESQWNVQRPVWNLGDLSPQRVTTLEAPIGVRKGQVRSTLETSSALMTTSSLPASFSWILRTTNSRWEP